MAECSKNIYILHNILAQCALIGWMDQCVLTGQTFERVSEHSTKATQPGPAHIFLFIYFFLHLHWVGII